MAYTKNIVTTVAYMIGIRKSIVENIAEENMELLNFLCDSKNCKIIRYLCKLRTSLMLNFKKTDIEMVDADVNVEIDVPVINTYAEDDTNIDIKQLEDDRNSSTGNV